MGSPYEDRFLPQGMRPGGMGPPVGRPHDLARSDMPGSFPGGGAGDELHLPSNGFSNPQSPTSRRKNSSRPSDQPNASPRDLEIPAESDIRKAREDKSSRSPAGRERSRTQGGRKNSGAMRMCGKCQGHLTGQFVRALGDTYHLECFTCHDCGKIVASKFFPVPDQPPNQYPLCETDYFRRLELLCYECGGALRGSYITALDRKYHIEHFTCSVCPTVFGAQDSYYEHEGNVYCHYHYSTRFAQRCNGCQTAILKQFVEIYREGRNQHWHPECYMIHKYWNVRLHSSGQPVIGESVDDENASEEARALVRTEEEKVEEKVLWIWRTLSNFEERSATCISDMLLHVSNGAYIDGVLAAKKFIMHIEMLFGAADGLDYLLTTKTPKGLSYSRESKLLCKKVVAFFGLLRESQTTGVRRLGVTQELLSLVTGLAHYLKLLIRICLQGALRLERETHSQQGLQDFLEQVNHLDERLELDPDASSLAEASEYVDASADTCPVCNKPVEDKCVRSRHRVFHVGCMSCQHCGRDLHQHLDIARWSEATLKLLCTDDAVGVYDAEGDFEQITRLTQYVFLLKVAHARLLATLRTSGALPHTSDDPNLATYDSSRGLRLTPTGEAVDISEMRLASRSRSYAGESTDTRQEGEQRPTYDQTLSDIRRLRSTRMDKHLSQTMKKARTSRIIDGPEGATVRPGSSGEGTASRNNNFQIVQDRDANGEIGGSLTINDNSLTLDDIPRLVAAEQAKEQRPNASKYARGLIPQEPQPKLVNGHRREMSGGNELERPDLQGYRGKRYFSELSALEYFIIRHLAVLSMEPLLEGQFNQEELLDMIEKKRSPTFWGKFGKAFGAKEPGQKKSGKKKGVFGVPLDQIVDRDGTESTDGIGPGALRIPAVVQDAITAMRTMDMSVEGVFRKNGNIKRLNEIQAEIDVKGGDAVDLDRETPVQIAALLKRFLRMLPDPVLTFKLHRLIISSQQINDPEKRRRILHLTCCLLPKSHRDTMEVLFCFLNWVSSFSHIDEESGSKMDLHNLATVMAPNILYSNSKTQGMDDSLLAIEAVHSLLSFNETMCEIPEDLQSILTDSTLFESTHDITTKEILRRWGDIRHSPLNASSAVAETPTSATLTPSGGKSSITRVDNDDAFTQPQSSVRHVFGEGSAGEEFPAPTVPYAREQVGGRGSSESQRSAGGRGFRADNSNSGARDKGEHRMSAFVRQPGPGVGSVGAG